MAKGKAEPIEPSAETADAPENKKPDTEALVAETLSGDVRDFLVDRIKNLPKVWAEMTQEEQRDIIYDAVEASNHLVRQAVALIAKDGRPTITAQCESVTVKDGIKAVLTLSKHDELRHALTDSQGQSVLIVVVDAENYIGARGDLKPDAKPSEPELSDQDGNSVFDNTPMGKAA